jgi:hypothetical protein
MTPERDALHRQLDRAVTQYTSVNTILWTVFSIFAAGQAVLAAAAFGRRPLTPVGGIVLSLVGREPSDRCAIPLYSQRKPGTLREVLQLPDLPFGP